MGERVNVCPGNHTAAPSGYLQWHEWAEQKGKTHRPKLCTLCGRFAVWVPKQTRANDGAQEQGR